MSEIVGKVSDEFSNLIKQAYSKEVHNQLNYKLPAKGDTRIDPSTGRWAVWDGNQWMPFKKRVATQAAEPVAPKRALPVDREELVTILCDELVNTVQDNLPEGSEDAKVVVEKLMPEVVALMEEFGFTYRPTKIPDSSPYVQTTLGGSAFASGHTTTYGSGHITNYSGNTYQYVSSGKKSK